MRARARLPVLLAVLGLARPAAAASHGPAATLAAEVCRGLGAQLAAGAVIVDSAMTREEALRGVRTDCPAEVLARQELLTVQYHGFDGRLHAGQLVLDRRLVPDIQQIFALARELRFPIQSVIPISHPRFRKDGRWDDDLSMEANNTSAFNYREPTGGGPISNAGHAMGFAIDINPVQNPYIKGGRVLPPRAAFVPGAPGTLDARHPIVQRFRALGWTWGGDWRRVKDYQHFQKRPR